MKRNNYFTHTFLRHFRLFRKRLQMTHGFEVNFKSGIRGLFDHAEFSQIEGLKILFDLRFTSQKLLPNEALYGITK